jgi:hypothetical protein
MQQALYAAKRELQPKQLDQTLQTDQNLQRKQPKQK